MPDEPQCTDRTPDNSSSGSRAGATNGADVTPASADAGAALFSGRKSRRVALTLLVGVLAAGGAVWLQKKLWPRVRQERAPVQASQMNGLLFPVKSAFDWEAPPLPPQSKVQVRLMRGSREQGNLRLQLLCASPLTAAEVMGFYEAELAKAGWKKYNVPAELAAGAEGGLYRMGNLSLAMHALPQMAGPVRAAEKGCSFRFSVLMQPVAQEPPAGGAEPERGQ